MDTVLGAVGVAILVLLLWKGKAILHALVFAWIVLQSVRHPH